MVENFLCMENHAGPLGVTTLLSGTCIRFSKVLVSAESFSFEERNLILCNFCFRYSEGTDLESGWAEYNDTPLPKLVAAPPSQSRSSMDRSVLPAGGGIATGVTPGAGPIPGFNSIPQQFSVPNAGARVNSPPLVMGSLPSGQTVEVQLQKLQVLRDQQVITAEVYERGRAKIMGSGNVDVD